LAESFKNCAANAVTSQIGNRKKFTSTGAESAR
jgi:hypothetical protein